MLGASIVFAPNFSGGRFGDGMVSNARSRLVAISGPDSDHSNAAMEKDRRAHPGSGSAAGVASGLRILRERSIWTPARV